MLLLSGKRNDDEGAKEKLYTYVSHVPVASFKVRPHVLHSGFFLTRFQGLQTVVVDAE